MSRPTDQEIKITALNKSIERWEDAEKNGELKGFCSLCDVYCCEDCPVMEHTGKHSCEATPYYEFISERERRISLIEQGRFQDAAPHLKKLRTLAGKMVILLKEVKDKEEML